MHKKQAFIGLCIIIVALLIMVSSANASCDQVRQDAVNAMTCKQNKQSACKQYINKDLRIYRAMRASLYQYPLHFKLKYKTKVIKRYSSQFYNDCIRGTYG